MADTFAPILPADISDKAERVLKIACDAKLSLATAESCTGGLLAALFTDISGCSHAFERGFVVYSSEAKCDLLHVSRKQVERCGAVSTDVALAMARGALEASRADLAMAITGYAGPGADDAEEGLVHLACQRRNGQTFHREEHYGPIGRDGVRLAALRTALCMIEQALTR